MNIQKIGFYLPNKKSLKVCNLHTIKNVYTFRGCKYYIKKIIIFAINLANTFLVALQKSSSNVFTRFSNLLELYYTLNVDIVLYTDWLRASFQLPV